MSVFLLFLLHTFLQITTLINHKDKPKKSERTLAAIHRVGQAVSVAVGRFVAVGEAIATENQELKDEMGQACFEARRAGRRLWLDFIMYSTFHRLVKCFSFGGDEDSAYSVVSSM